MNDFCVLIAVALPSSGPELLRVARLLAPLRDLRVTALHCRVESDVLSDNRAHGDGENARNPLHPMLQESDGVSIEPITRDSADVEEDILLLAREREADLILLGWHRPMVPDGEWMGPVRGIFERTERDAAVFLARQRRPFRRVLVPFHGGRHDRRALEFAARFSRHAGVNVTVLHVIARDRGGSSPASGLSDVVEDFSDGRVRLKVVESDDPVDAAIHESWTGYDLIVAGASEVWGVDFSLFSEPLQQLALATPASLLVVRAGRSPCRDELSTTMERREKKESGRHVGSGT